MDSCLIKKASTPCKKGTPPLKGDELKKFFEQLEAGWSLTLKHHIEKEYLFKNFQEALLFTNKAGAIAEKEGHHPDIYLSYGKVLIKLYRHKIDSLSENDFILAAKCDDVI